MDSEEEKLIEEEIAKQEEKILNINQFIIKTNNHPLSLSLLSKEKYYKTEYVSSYSFRYMKFKKEVIDMVCADDTDTPFKKLIIKPIIYTRIAYTDISLCELYRMVKSGSDKDEIEFINSGGCIKLIKTNEQSNTYWLDKNMVALNKRTLIGFTYLSKVLIKKIKNDTVYNAVENHQYDIYNDYNSDYDDSD